MEVNFSLARVNEEEVNKLINKLIHLVNREFMPFTGLTTDEELRKVAEVSARLREHSNELVVVGIGGSSRGTKAVYEAVGKLNGRLKFIDNIDPCLVSKIFNQIEWESSSFAFISKSGKTLETVTVLNAVLDELRRRNLEPGKRCVFIGDSGNPFEELAKELRAPFLPIPKEVGGRFSVFTAVGLLPLKFNGFKVEELLEGAERVVKEPVNALKLASVKFFHYRENRKVTVVMPYSSFMGEFTEWYVQLWAESLGKDGHGPTPLKALGTSSQHAILQLFLDGPDDKLYQLFFVENHPEDKSLPEETRILPFLSRKRLSQVMEAEFKGTVHSLKEKGRPVIVFRLKELSEEEMGELLMSYMVAVAAKGALLGVNPYGQPAVELGKKVALEELLK
jgi:glucose-6-phosphate isomerase